MSTNLTPTKANTVTLKAAPIAVSIDTPEAVVTFLSAAATGGYVKSFLAEHGRLPEAGEDRGRRLFFYDLALGGYMLRDDVSLARRLDIAAEAVARAVARSVTRAQARQDALS